MAIKVMTLSQLSDFGDLLKEALVLQNLSSHKNIAKIEKIGIDPIENPITQELLRCITLSIIMETLTTDLYKIITKKTKQYESKSKSENLFGYC